MDSSENKQGAPAPEPKTPAQAEAAAHTGESSSSSEPTVSHEQTTDASGAYSYHDDYGYEQPYDAPPASEQSNLPVPAAASKPPALPPPPPPPKDEDEDDDDEGMLRMSFLEHLEELRFRIIRCLMGVGVAFVVSLVFTDWLWRFIREPFAAAMALNGVPNAKLVVTTPMEAFSIIWIKLPIICAIFLSSPWILYQVWAFIAPGLYKKERRWAAPFVISSAGLFIIGGVFSYYVAFRLGLAFLLGIAVNLDVQAMVTITEYFDLFVNVSLGMGIVFELPVIIFFLTLLRIVTPAFLLSHSRYAILIITIIAAIVTPTPDAINLMIVTVPMVALYFVGVLASYILWLSREGRKFPWKKLVVIPLLIILAIAVVVYLAFVVFGIRVVQTWPFIVR